MTIVGRLDFPARRGIPLAYGPIRRGRHEAPAIRAKRDAQYLVSCALDIGDHAAGGRVPEPCTTIFAGGGEARAIRAENKVPGIADFMGRGRHGFARLSVVHRRIPRPVGRSRSTASREPSGLTATSSVSVPGGPFSCVWTRPWSSRTFTKYVAEESYGRTDSRGVQSPVFGEKPQSVPGQEWGVMQQWVSGGNECARSSFPSRSCRRRPVRRQGERSGCLPDHGSGTEIRPRRAPRTRNAVVEPRVQVSPFPVAQGFRGRVELAGRHRATSSIRNRVRLAAAIRAR